MCVEVGKGSLGIDGVRVRIVRVPDDVLAFKVIDYVLERALVAVAGDHALAHEVVARTQPQLLRLAHDAVSSMGVIVHASEPKGEPAGVGFEYGEPQFGKTLKNSRKNKMAEGGHVVARETEGMVQTAKRQLHIVVSLSLEMAKRMIQKAIEHRA